MVSIITVVRNGATTIERTILSVINQDYQDYEFIIIDGKSTDDTLKIINLYSDRIQKVISEPDNGIYDAMNKGISLATGDWVYFLGCDDILYSKSILSEIFKNNLGMIDVVYGNVMYEHSKIIYDGEFDYNKFSNKCVCHQAIFYRRSLFSKFGSFETKYVTTADYVLNIRLFCSNDIRWQYIDKIVAMYNENGASYSIEDETYLNDRFEIRYSNFRGHVSNLTLSRIFWSSYPRYLKTHKIPLALKLLVKSISDIGISQLFYNGLLITRQKLYGRLKN